MNCGRVLTEFKSAQNGIARRNEPIHFEVDRQDLTRPSAAAFPQQVAVSLR